MESVCSVPVTIQKNFHHGLDVRGLSEAPRTTLRGPPKHLVVRSGEAAIRSRWPSISMGRREVMMSWISRHRPEKKEKRKGTPERMPTCLPGGRACRFRGI